MKPPKWLTWGSALWGIWFALYQLLATCFSFNWIKPPVWVLDLFYGSSLLIFGLSLLFIYRWITYFDGYNKAKRNAALPFPAQQLNKPTGKPSLVGHHQAVLDWLASFFVKELKAGRKLLVCRELGSDNGGTWRVAFPITKISDFTKSFGTGQDGICVVNHLWQHAGVQSWSLYSGEGFETRFEVILTHEELLEQAVTDHWERNQ